MQDERLKAAAAAVEVLGPVLDRAGGPLGLVGRAIGMGPDELRAGVPRWACVGIGMVVGAGLAVLLRDRISAFAER